MLRIFFNALIEMKPRSGFVISIFLISLIFPLSTRAQQKKCAKVDVTIEVTDSQNGKPGSIKVSADKQDAKFMLHLLGEGETIKDEQLKITTGTIENIRPGTYDLIIHYKDARYCSETRKVTVN